LAVANHGEADPIPCLFAFVKGINFFDRDAIQLDDLIPLLQAGDSPRAARVYIEHLISGPRPPEAIIGLRPNIYKGHNDRNKGGQGEVERGEVKQGP